MRKRAHRHRAVKSKQAVKGWYLCVTPAECAARPNRQQAHGNIVYMDTCQCGATREAESNGGRVNYGTWVEVKGDD